MIEVVVRDIHQETRNIRRISLERADGGELPAFTAGAHIDVGLPNGMVRQYSLMNLHHEGPVYQIGVLRAPQSRGGSQWMHESLKAGDRLQVSAPRNMFPLVADGKRHLLFAGGIGITPILSLARDLAARQADFEVSYCARSQPEAGFLAELDQLQLGDRLQVLTEGRNLARRSMANRLATPSPDTHIYVCGPSGYIDTVYELARLQGWPDAQLHMETFCPVPVAGNAADQPFTVHLARSGKVVPVGAGQTVVKALEAHGVHVPVSCEQGICGTCLTRVIDGQPDHRDQYLTDEERDANDQFTPCCSRAVSAELVLDL